MESQAARQVALAMPALEQADKALASVTDADMQALREIACYAKPPDFVSKVAKGTLAIITG